MTVKSVLLDRYFTIGGYRFSWVANRVEPNFTRSQVDDSSTEDLTDVIVKGQNSGTLVIAGAATSSAEKQALAAIKAETAYSLILGLRRGAAVGDAALINDFQFFRFGKTGALNELSGFELEGRADTMPRIGTMMWRDLPSGAGTTAPSDGTGINLGAIGAGQIGRFALAAMAPPGLSGTAPTFDVVLESDSADTWAGGEIQRGAFTQIDAAPFSEVIEIDGDATPVTDGWWRLRVNAVGGTGSPKAYLFAAGVVASK
jgi:hypothetical protein